VWKGRKRGKGGKGRGMKGGRGVKKRGDGKREEGKGRLTNPTLLPAPLLI